MGGLGHGLGGLVDLPQGEVAAARDREQDRPRAVHARLQQRRRDGLLRRLDRAPVAGRHADAQQRVAGLGHDRADVGEVEVDQAGQRDQVGDALDALAQHVVGDLEGLDHRRVLVEHREQPVVGHHDQRVDLVGQRLHALVGLLATARALEAERLGDDADRERADLARDARQDRRRAGAGAPAGARGHEHHVRALEQRLDLVVLLHRRLAAEVRVRSRPEAARDLRADVERHVRRALLQRLQVRVDADELDALDLRVDHAVDGVDAGAADADHAKTGAPTLAGWP